MVKNQPLMDHVGVIMSEITRERSRRPHIMVFPYPAQGHLLPLLDLTNQLCLRGLVVSVVITTGNLQYLSPLLSKHPSSVFSPVVFPFPSHPSLPPGVENVKDVGNSGNIPFMSSLRNLREPLLHWFRSHRNPPVAVVSDFFLGWTQDLCDQISVPRFAFFSSGPFLASVLQICFDDVDAVRSKDQIRFYDLPRSPIFKEEHLPSLVRRCLQSPSSPDLTAAVKDISMNFESYGLVFNSVKCVEDEYFEYVKKKVCHNRVLGVGPVCLTGFDPVKPGSDSLMSWLDGCEDGSVLYVCFGSQTVLTKEQCVGLALGLEKSKTRFVWVVKKDPIPDGFEDRIPSKGIMVRGWVPQVSVLRHLAVGGFLSHCGWNSVLEALTSGVTVLGWPMEADQFVNAKLLVDDLGVAVRVCEGAQTVPDPVELGRVIGETMGERGRGLGARAEEMQRIVVAATEDKGSSFVDLERLVEELHNL